MLKVEKLSGGYGSKEVLHEISFSVKANEKLCILGPNGCGKTTLLRAISGLLPSSGKVTFDGMDVHKAGRREVAKKIALMSQISGIPFCYTVFETVLMGRYAHMKPGIFNGKSEVNEKMVLECLNKVGMVEQKDRLITELSGGQLQRVFLARVFAQDPQMILLDEPTNHLDLKYQIELMEELKKWANEKSRCVIGVLHDINHALNFADTILLLKEGAVQRFDKRQNFQVASLNTTYGMDVKSYMLKALERWNDSL
ncbi:MAG: ABC transporter ATP-binding protein [Acetivibrio sp.]